MNTVSFYTLGCKLNYTETLSLEKQFSERNFSTVPFEQQANICVINTCSVTERADREARKIVRQALRTSPDTFIIVVGCYAQLDPEEIASIDGVDIVLGTSEKFRLFEHINKFEKLDSPKIFVSPINQANDFGPAYSTTTKERTRAFLKIQDGCDFNCSFCTIPLARGNSRSQSIHDCVEQAKKLVEMGYKEIILTGVNVGDYGKRNQTSLLQLLPELENIDGLQRIRISSIEPNLLNKELLHYWIQSEKICNHFHLPLQSGTDEILRMMRRRYTSTYYKNLIYSIKELSPNAGIGVDVIVGFPGETQELFEQSYKFLHELPISYLHVFTYSERPNTPSINFPNRIEPRIRYSNSEKLRQLGAMKKSHFYQTYLGTTQKVLLEGTIENNFISGYTENYIRVNIPHQTSLENTIASIHLTEYNGEECMGKINHDF